MSVAAVNRAPITSHAAASATADKSDAPTTTSLGVRLGTIALVGGTITGLSAYIGMQSVAKAAKLKGGIIGGVAGAIASAALIAATGLATRSGGSFGSGAAGSGLSGLSGGSAMMGS